ncbi:fimbrial protein [Buttiauxella sp. 3AFRM03]|nr:fimbrial protein [Buttiauxella sp. 3AFRM03]
MISHRSRGAIFRYLALFILASGTSLACEAGVDMNINANIINNTCNVTVENNGSVHLPTVSRDYFSPRGNPPAPLSPTDAAGGQPFKITVDDCVDWVQGEANRLHFQFKPVSEQFPAQSKQVFINEASPSSGGAENVGVVIFSALTNTNVLKSDGSSDVIYDVQDQTSSEYLTDYLFYARYQNTGVVSAGRVASNIMVSVIYD